MKEFGVPGVLDGRESAARYGPAFEANRPKTGSAQIGLKD
jgi:hypothetical protein